MKKSLLLATAAAFLLGGAAALLAWSDWPRLALAGAPQPVWSETDWPFPTDQWGKGKAFRCAARDCGTDVQVYLRAKLGFCNCTTGVADDDELDRISDYDLLGNKLAGRGAGRPIAVGWMKG